MLFAALDRALAKGLNITGFRSGGGLRALYMDDQDGKTICHAWKPNVEWSLGVLASLYADVERDKEPIDAPGGFATGSLGSTGALDDVLCRGGKFKMTPQPITTIKLELIYYNERFQQVTLSCYGKSVLEVLLEAQRLLSPVKV